MIEITIKGCAGEGKSSIASLIMSALLKQRFDRIELNMLDAVDENWFERNALRIESIRERQTAIKIVEKMSNG